MACAFLLMLFNRQRHFVSVELYIFFPKYRQIILLEYNVVIYVVFRL